MSKSVHNSATDPGEQRRPYPRAIVHKQILDAARSEPTASVEALAANVSGASPTLVEQVINEYGDPAESESPSVDTTAESSDETSESDAESSQSADDSDTEAEPSTPPALSGKQRETLRAIYETPEATQQDLGERLGVTRATISQRVNSIDGFEWTNRERFVTGLFESEDAASMTQNQTDDSSGETTVESSTETETNASTDIVSNSTGEQTRSNSELHDRMETLSETVTQLERRLEKATDSARRPFEDPQLVHKIAHACLTSDQITEEEELRILESLLSGESANNAASE